MRDRARRRSLLPLLTRPPTASGATEFNPRGFQPGERQTGSAVQDALKAFELDRETGRLNIRRSERGKLLRQRQYAAIRGPQMIAAIPGSFSPGFRYLYVDALPRPGSRHGPPPGGASFQASFRRLACHPALTSRSRALPQRRLCDHHPAGQY